MDYQKIKIGNKEYPFHFGMRVFWYITNSGEIEFDEVDDRIQADYDAFLQMFVLANESALKKSDGNKITIDDLEFAIDENPELMTDLQNALLNSSVINKMQEQTEGKGKKPKE